VNNKKWCPVCNIDSQRNNINDIIKIVKKKNGELLTKKYKNNRQKLKIKCSKGHIWSVCYINFKKGYWCPTCAHINHRLTKEEKLKGFNLICKIVKEKGGKCLFSLENYKNITSKLKFQCNKNHKWKTSASCIKDNRWCPLCCQGLSERLFRCVLEKIFNNSFPTCYPKWLKSDKGYKLQIDGYNKKLKFGFEYQGEQHFIFNTHFHRTADTFKRRKQLDRTKKRILKNKNIFMLYPTYKLKKDDYFEFIKSKVENTRYKDIANFEQKININKLYKII